MHPQWQPATHPPPLTIDDVHVWRIELQVGDLLLAHLRVLLTDDERQRADRFYFEKDRRHFTAARGVMRILLARYLACRPEEVRFIYNNYGKPQLAEESNFRFNLTHSHGLALLAVTRGREIGVDVEQLRDMEGDGEPLAQRFFSPREVALLRSLPPQLRREAFFHCWTRKEAYIKAQGKGLSLPLDQFDVSIHPDEPAVLLATQPDPHEAQRWSLQGLLPREGYVGALAVEGHSWRLWCGDWVAEAALQGSADTP
jgi:4'-phosphopantetheinyl transferase